MRTQRAVWRPFQRVSRGTSPPDGPIDRFSYPSIYIACTSEVDFSLSVQPRACKVIMPFAVRRFRVRLRWTSAQAYLAPRLFTCSSQLVPMTSVRGEALSVNSKVWRLAALHSSPGVLCLVLRLVLSAWCAPLLSPWRTRQSILRYRLPSPRSTTSARRSGLAISAKSNLASTK